MTLKNTVEINAYYPGLATRVADKGMGGFVEVLTMGELLCNRLSEFSTKYWWDYRGLATRSDDAGSAVSAMDRATAIALERICYRYVPAYPACDQWMKRGRTQEQTIIDIPDALARLSSRFPGRRRTLLVTNKDSFQMSGAAEVLEPFLSRHQVERFYDYNYNAEVEDLSRGLERARQFRPDLIIGCGGGNAIDMAKLIHAQLAATEDLIGAIRANRIAPMPGVELIAIPTTCGSGSESTPFAVVYIDGRKYSLDHTALLPKAVVLLDVIAERIPPHVIAVSGIDAVCHAIESYWALQATPHSQRLALTALDTLLPNLVAAFNGDRAARRQLQHGANLAGRAIAISRTTSAHALSYHLTKTYGIPHGHAVALTLPYFIDEVARVRPLDALIKRIDRPRLLALMTALNLDTRLPSELELATWLASANPSRLGNSPVQDLDFLRKVLPSVVKA